MSFDGTEHAAGVLADLRVRVPGAPATALDDLPEACRPRTLMDGYRIQQRLRELLARRQPGAKVGWKIGCTTPAIQAYLKIPHPVAGTLYRNRIYRTHRDVDAGDFLRLGLECEIAVRLGQDLPLTDAIYDRHSVLPAVSEVRASVELIEHRYRDITRVTAASVVADDALSAGCVLGAPVHPGDLGDLDTLQGGFSVDDAPPVEIGSGAEVLGHPLTALAWLADLAARLGTPLLSGEVITLGSLTPVYYPRPGERIEARIDGLPPASVTVR